MEVRIIPARRTAARQDEIAARSLRVAAYCRVSTLLEEQEGSYEAQVSHYRSYIEAQPGWALAGIYADEGISGTGTRKREEFNRMIDDCRKGEIDLILTKSISRFARNTLDCLQYIRQLKERRIVVYFEKENINTLDAKGEILITIMASLAQQESQSISENVRMGIQYQFQQGKVRVNHCRFLGYTKDEEGKLVIVPEEAEIVRRIYREFLDGKSLRRIAAGLEADGIRTGSGGERWYDSSIRSILCNEKYMGDALLQKTYTVDFLTKKKRANYGELPRYYVENNHEPILSREIFQRAQGELQRRANVREENGSAGQHSCKYALSGRLVCSHCGAAYRRMKARDDRHSTFWRCKQHLQQADSCSGRPVPEAEAQAAVMLALECLAQRRDCFQKQYERIRSGPYEASTAKLDQIFRQLAALQERLAGATEEERTAVEDQMEAVRQQRIRLTKKRARVAHRELILRQLLAFFDHRFGPSPGQKELPFDEEMILPLLKQVRVRDEGYTVQFQIGPAFTVTLDELPSFPARQ